MIGLPHLRAGRRSWVWPVLAIVLVAGHGVFLYAAARLSLSAAVFSGAIILLVIKHAGLLGPLYAWLRRRERRGGG